MDNGPVKTVPKGDRAVYTDTLRVLRRGDQINTTSSQFLPRPTSFPLLFHWFCTGTFHTKLSRIGQGVAGDSLLCRRAVGDSKHNSRRTILHL